MRSFNQLASPSTVFVVPPLSLSHPPGAGEIFVLPRGIALPSIPFCHAGAASIHGCSLQIVVGCRVGAAGMKRGGRHWA